MISNKSSFKLVRGDQIEAQYLQQQLEEYIGNPLIEGLPHILSKEEVFEKIIFLPVFNEKERFLKENLRIH